MSDEPDPSIQQSRHCGEAAVYLLGLLDERQGSAFLEHARSCSVCSDELEALAPAVDALPATVSQMSAPGDVKRRVMATVRGESVQSTGAARRSRWVRERLRLRHPALALAGAGALAAGVAIGVLSAPFHGTAPPSAGGTARVVSAQVTLAGVSAALHQSAGHTWLTVAHMPVPSSGHVYEVWVKRPGHTLPQATDSLFTPTVSGAATADVPNGAGASEVLVTQEPAGGSRLPSTSPIIVARLS